MKNKQAFTLSRHAEFISASSRYNNKTLNQVQGDGRKGFTLIELLVVVLIIGILAAVALPQYQKAVMKSHFSILKPAAKAVRDAQEVYYYGNGEYTEASSNLDIQVPQEVNILLNASNEYASVTAYRDTRNRYTMYFNHSENFAGNIYCEALESDEQAKALCMAEGGVEGPANGGYILYLLAGNSTGNFGPNVMDSSPYEGWGGHGFEFSYSDGSVMRFITQDGDSKWLVMPNTGSCTMPYGCPFWLDTGRTGTDGKYFYEVYPEICEKYASSLPTIFCSH